MDRRTRLLPAILIATVVLAAAPATLRAATLSNKATMFLRTTYLLKAQLDYARGTVKATETITLTNTSGTTISKLNLSVLPKAFGELVSIGSYTVDDRATSAVWSNNARTARALPTTSPRP